MKGIRPWALTASVAALLVACGGEPTPTRQPEVGASAPATPATQGSARLAPAPPADEDHDLLVSALECEKPTAPSVRRDEVVAELAIVERIVRGGYAGLEAAEARDVSWDRAFAKLKQDAALLPDPIYAERYSRWLARGLAVADDAALKVVVHTLKDEKPYHLVETARDREVKTSLSVALFRKEAGRYRLEAPDKGAALVLRSCEGVDLDRAMWPALLERPLRVRFRLAMTGQRPPDRLTCVAEAAGGALERVELALDQPPSRFTLDPLPPFSVTEGAVTTLDLRRIGSLEYGMKENRDAFEKLRPKKTTAPMVLDLRHTSTTLATSRDSYWPLDDSWIARFSFPGPSIDRLTGSVVAQGKVNDLRCTVARVIENDAKRRAAQDAEAALAQLELERRDRLGGAETPRRWTERVRWTTPHGKPPALVAVVDEGCGGTCEDLLTILQNGSGVVLLGRRTAGTGREREVLPYRLPRSGLWLYVPSATFLRPAATADTGAFVPDLFLDSPDPLPIARELAACLAKEQCKRSLESGGWRAPAKR